MIINNIAAPVNTVTQTAYMTVNLNGQTRPFPLLAIGRGSYIVGGASVQSMLDFDVDAGIHNLQIGQFCSLATNITFMVNMNHDFKEVSTGASSLLGYPSKRPSKITRRGQILLQNDVWLGHGTTIMSGVTIHNGAVVAANSHVVKDVPPYAIVGGNPARIIKFRFTDGQIADLLAISWWDWDDEKLLRRRKDFGLPIEEFIARHRVSVPPDVPAETTERGRTVYLFFPDIMEPYPIWEKVIRAYSSRFAQDSDAQLLVYLPENENTDFCRKRLNTLLNPNRKNKDGILVQVGQAAGEAELFRRADCYITTRALQTVYRSCLADKFNVKILSGVDEPLFAGQ